MRPYLAVIKDSFREALASRTLWILLILIALTLAALAPFTYHQVLTSGLQRRDVTDVDEFIEELRRAENASKPSPARHVWMQLDPALRAKARQLEKPARDASPPVRFAYQQTVEELCDALNTLMQREDFYDPQAWRGVDMQPEGRRLAVSDPATLNDEEIGRRNRLALEAAFPQLIRLSRPLSTQFTYLGWELAWPVPIAPDDLQQQLLPWIVFVLDWVVGPVGVFVAVLVTASIIPQMFDAGALNLLLSKPISRSLLFLFKFLGGCAFILIAATILFTGLWLILGVRLDIWSHKLLLYIPIYLFLFSIYYVVSAFSGLVWRSTVVAVAVSIAFWATCYGVGSAEWALKSFLIDPQRIIYITPTNDSLLTLDEFRVPHVWDAEAREWQEIFLTEQQQRIRNQFPVPLPNVVAKVYDPRRDRLLAIQREFGGGRAVWAGKGSEGWRRMGGADAPSDVMGLFLEPQGTVIVVSRAGVQRLTGDPEASTERKGILFGLGNLLPRQPLFSDASQDLPGFDEPHAAAMNPESGDLAIYSRGTVYRLARQENGNYAITAERRLDRDEEEPAIVAFGGDTLLVAAKNGDVLELDSQSLVVRDTHRPEQYSPPRFAYAVPGGQRLALIFHNGNLWMFDNREKTLSQPAVTGQGQISAVAFPSPDEMLVADRSTRVSRYQIATLKLQDRISPEMDLLEVVYRYVVVPIYTVFPKPSELYKTSQYLITGQETQAIDDDDDDLSDAHVKLHPWRPVWSSFAFLVAMLVFACIYFERQEF